MKKKRARIFIVDDHPMVRERLVELINHESDLVVCGEADDVRAAFEAILLTQPDLAIVDLTLKSTHGIELIKDLKVHGEKLPILVLSMHDESIYAERVLRAGARGYLTKQEPTAKVLGAIRQILQGHIYVSAKSTAKFLRHYVDGKPDRGGVGLDQLSDRELEVYQMLGQGRATREIAAALHVDIKTVETYRSRIKEKLSLNTAIDLVMHATQWMLDAGQSSNSNRPG